MLRKQSGLDLFLALAFAFLSREHQVLSAAGLFFVYSILYRESIESEVQL